jgi:uncharacterized membrane protein
LSDSPNVRAVSVGAVVAVVVCTALRMHMRIRASKSECSCWSRLLAYLIAVTLLLLLLLLFCAKVRNSYTAYSDTTRTSHNYSQYEHANSCTNNHNSTHTVQHNKGSAHSYGYMCSWMQVSFWLVWCSHTQSGTLAAAATTATAAVQLLQLQQQLKRTLVLPPEGPPP